MGNRTEFVRVADILIDTLDFDRDISVSVFETNIRGIYNFYQTTEYALMCEVFITCMLYIMG